VRQGRRGREEGWSNGLMSRSLLATRIVSALVQTLNQTRRQQTSAAIE